MAKERSNLIGAWAFLIGIILAAIFAIFSGAGGTWIPWVLFIIGIIVGLLNIADAEAQPFLISGAILVIVSSFGGAVFSQLVFIPQLLTNILALFVPATIVVALKSVFSMARS